MATKQIKQGRLSEYPVTYTLPVTQHAAEKFAKKLLGDTEIEAVVQRLDRLTQEEARMAATQTLGVVHGLVDNMKVVMEGTKSFVIVLVYFFEYLFCRWKNVNG